MGIETPRNRHPNVLIGGPVRILLVVSAVEPPLKRAGMTDTEDRLATRGATHFHSPMARG